MPFSILLGRLKLFHFFAAEKATYDMTEEIYYFLSKSASFLLSKELHAFLIRKRAFVWIIQSPPVSERASDGQAVTQWWV